MAEPTAVIAHWSVGGLSRLEVKPGGGAAAGILVNGIPGGKSKGIVEYEKQSSLGSVLQRRFLAVFQSAVTVEGRGGYLECSHPSFGRQQSRDLAFNS